MIPNDLITYIENEMKRGVSHDAIQEALVVAGWKPLDVADAFRLVTEKAHGISSGSLEEKPIGIEQPKDGLLIVEEPTTSLNISGISESASVLKIENSLSNTKVTETVEIKPKRSLALPVLIVFGLIALIAAGYFFVLPLINDPAKKVRAIVETIEKARSVQYSGEYEISAPAGAIFGDKVLVSSFGGLSERQAGATIKGTFFGADDWFDLRSKKNEVKFTTKATVSETINMDFSTTSRFIGNAFYSKLSESAATFDDVLSNQGANWVRFDGDSVVPSYAYGFWGGTNLYANGFPRELAIYLSQATVGEAKVQQNGETLMSVNLPSSLVDYFSNIAFTGDKLNESNSLGTKYTVSSLTELPTGELTFDPSGVIKKATILFSYKTKEYTIPIHIKFTLSFDRFDTPPSINIPSLVVAFADLEKQNVASDLPQALKGFFTDVRTIASVYKGINENSFRGVCIKKGEESEISTELTIPYISTKVIASGFELPVCSDTDTAWSYYTHSSTGYYCTDSRGYSGKVARQPLGDKCN